MNGIIIYSTQYGATKEYADWMAEDLKLKSVSIKDFKLKDLNNYDFVIMGSSIIAYKLTIMKWLNKNLEKMRDKKLFLFTVSGANPNDKSKISTFIDNSLSKDVQEKIKFFSLHGRMIFKKLPFVIQLLMRMVAKTQKDPKIRREFLKDYDYVKRENIKPIVDEISKITCR